MSLKDFLKDLLNLGQDDVFRVDVKDSFSFFNTDKKHQDLVMNIFNDFKLDGRNISVEISKDGRKKGGGRSGGKGGRGKGKRSGKSFDGGGSKFKGKSRRRSERPSGKGTGGKRRRRN